MEIVMNEREWVENALRVGYLGKKPTIVIGRLAKYYYAQGMKKREIRKRIEEHMLRCDPTVNTVRWQDTIDAMIKGAAKYPLIELDEIVVTVDEIETIMKLDGIQKQRLMFTLVCLAKYSNAIREKNGGWVNQESKDIFSLANITLTAKRQALMINDLWKEGYVGYSRIVDNVNLCVQIINDDSDPAITITDFRNLGNQFRAYLGDKSYFQCQNCGAVIKRRSNSHKYCSVCAEEVNRAKALEAYESRRNEASIPKKL